MTPRLHAVALALAGLNLSLAAAEGTTTVCSSGCDFTSINAAIQAANEGDTITIAAGNYYEGAPLDPNGKAVHLLGALNECGGPAVYIDGTGIHRGIECTSGETTETLFENLVIRNGYTLESKGAGVLIDASSPRFVNCMFSNNAPSSNNAGGAASIRNAASPVFELCTFSGNQAASGAAASVNSSSSPTFDTCTFVNNVATSGPSCGLIILNGGSTLISGCTFSGNFGAPGWANTAISSLGSVPTITNTIVCDNDVSGDYTDGGGNCFDACSTCSPTYGDMDCDGVTDDADECPYGNTDDSDGDGTPDCEDLCPGDDGKTEYGVCGCGVPDNDTDRDGVPDCIDFCPEDPNCSAPTITVCSVGCDFTSINAAIDSAEDGDVIVLSPGFYYEGEEVNFDGKGITLRGSVDANGDPNTVLDGQGLHRVLRATDGMVPGVEITIENLIIQNGFEIGDFSSLRGAGLFIDGSNVAAITNCTIRSNYSDAGSGIYCYGTSPAITKCTFENNIARFEAGGLYIGGSGSLISECQFINNLAEYEAGAASFGGGNHTVQNCYFAYNKAAQGGAIGIRGTEDLTLSGCTITRNLALGGDFPFPGASADGAAMLINSGSLATLKGCNVWCHYGDSVMSGPFVQVDSCIKETPGCQDECGADSDFDGVIDLNDVCPGENDFLDTDQDGTPDCIDGCPQNPMRTNPGVCGCGSFEDVAGDLDCDGDYDADDARLAMAEFGIIEAGACPADLNGDSVVDGQDLAIVLGAWGLPCGGTGAGGDG